MPQPPFDEPRAQKFRSASLAARQTYARKVPALHAVTHSGDTGANPRGDRSGLRPQPAPFLGARWCPSRIFSLVRPEASGLTQLVENPFGDGVRSELSADVRRAVAPLDRAGADRLDAPLLF